MFSPRTVGADFAASLVVFLVAVPLALGIALASGAPIAAGLIGCIVGGIVGGLVAGAPLQVSGPAAGLTVVVFGLVHQYGWPTVCAITLAAGLIQIALGLLKVARACLVISPAVVHGMLAGIGVTIALAQAQVLLGGAPGSSALKNLAQLPVRLTRLVTEPSPAATHATILGLLTIAVLLGWSRLPAKVRMVPGALVAVLFSTVVGNTLLTSAPRVSVPDTNLFALNLPHLPVDPSGFAVAALTVALVASVESLLCAVATDKLHTGPRAHLDRELIAQGAANMVSGLLGGLPVTGVIVRSAANVTAGAKTRLSAILHGLWVVLFVLLATSQLNRIPLAALAGLLVHVGVGLINQHHIRELRVHREMLIYLVTALAVAFLNLLTGVLLGLGLAVFFLLKRMSYLTTTVNERTEPGGTPHWHLRIEGALTFLSVPQLAGALARVPPGAHVDIDLLVEFMDHAAFDALHGWRRTHEKTGGSVDIDEVHESWYWRAADGDPKVQRVAAPTE